MSRLPKVFVFDLDGCVWAPEMYQLWGSGGSPFRSEDGGRTLVASGGAQVRLLGDVREICLYLKTNSRFSDCEFAVASCCDEPGWARECLEKFRISEDGIVLKDVLKHLEIYKGNKARHLETIARKLSVKPEEMIFFDNEYGNCQNVADIGVTVVYTPVGITRKLFDEGLERFPSPGKILGPKKR